MPRRHDPTVDLPAIFTAEQALAAGFTRDQIRQRLRSGDWQRLARGAYGITLAAADAGPSGLHGRRAVAAALTHPGAVIGFDSALVLHGLPLDRPLPDTVSLCVGDRHWSGTRGGIRFRRGGLPPDAVDPAFASSLVATPIQIVTAACAWVQVTASGTLADGLVTGDAGLRRRSFTRDDLRSAFIMLRPVRGQRLVEAALLQVDGRRESPLESQSWVYFLRNRIPLPQLQVEIVDEWGDFVGRVDTLWSEARVIGEVDGRSKYETRDDVYREKRREDALRAMGFEVIRWGFSDLRSRALALRITRTLERRGRIAA